MRPPRVTPTTGSAATFAIPETKLIHIDIDPSEIGRNYPTEIGAVADLKAALTTLTRIARFRSRVYR